MNSYFQGKIASLNNEEFNIFLITLFYWIAERLAIKNILFFKKFIRLNYQNKIRVHTRIYITFKTCYLLAKQR